MRFLVCLLLLPVFAGAQFRNESTDTSWKKIYRETPEKRHDLIHTKLDVKFDYNNSYLYGKEWLTLKPHFYEYDTVILDARGMIISKVSIVKGTTQTDLQYRYDGAQLFIKTDKTYKKNEKFTLYFEYTSRPNELKAKGSAAITSAKGLYFINPLGKTPNKPTQIWTQGETEANSAWMITIDKPNQKTTQEISMTVPDKYVSLSNGTLVSSKKNADGTRTDYWKQDLPHAPYLFFMGVGDYSVTKDKYKNKEVSYYVEREYAPYARGIFGLTPEMMACYERLTGVDYPWAKYAQIVGRDFVSGAMENTTATLHQSGAQQNGRELADGNGWEETIAHELFHHWFGDLVTTESWSNITLNESFANYGEYLWLEYKYGKDKADEHNFQDMGQYLMSGSDEKDLVRYHYADKEDVFDLVSYPKGGRILHMLRNHIGDSAFFKGINLYLTENRFKSAEVAQLRMAFEEVTGKDLNWYFNQWYFGSGHPELKINYEYDDAAGKAKVIVNQTQKSGKLFKLPVAVDVIEDGKKKRYMEWIDEMNDTLVFNYVKRPQLINVDADKVLLAEKTDNKTSENYQAQWKYAGNYMDRYEAINHFAKKNMPELAEGLRDPYDGIRQLTIQKLGSSAYKNDPVVLETMENLALSKSGGKVRAAAISFLVKNGDRKYAYIYEKAVNDSSYSVAGASLKGLMDMDPDNSYNLAKKYSGDAKGPLGRIVNETLMKKGKEEDFDFLAERYGDMPLSDEKISQTRPFINYLGTLKDENNIKKGIDKIMDMRSKVPEEYRNFIDPMLSRPLNDLGKSKGENIRKYVEEKMEEK